MANEELNNYLSRKNGMLTKKSFGLKNEIKTTLSELIDKGVSSLGVKYHGRIRCGGKEEKITFDTLRKDGNGDVFLYDSENNISYLCTLLLFDEMMSLIENLYSRTFRKTPLTEPKEERRLIIPATEEEKLRGIGDTIHIGENEVIL